MGSIMEITIQSWDKVLHSLTKQKKKYLVKKLQLINDSAIIKEPGNAYVKNVEKILS